MYDYYLNGRLINNSIIEFSYSENINDVATNFEFTSIQDFGLTLEINGQTVLNRIEICEVGETTPFYVGFITDEEHTNDRNVYKYIGFDVGFYLNKNQVVKQFKGENIKRAIIALCSEYKIGEFNNQNQFSLNIPNFTQTIKKIYKGETFGDIIKEMLELERAKGGLQDTYIDCKNGGLNIRRYQVVEELIAVVADALLLDSFTTQNKVSVKHSIQNLKNRVIVTDNANDKITKERIERDNASIAIYGLLTHVEKIDTDKNNNLKRTATEKLSELNRVTEEISLNIIADHRAGKGVIIPLNIEEYGLNGLYLITSANHRIYRNREEIAVNLKKREEKTT
jgi:hypothetical protein